MQTLTDPPGHFKPFADLRKLPGRLTLSPRVIRPLLTFLAPGSVLKVAVQTLLRTVFRGYKNSSSGLKHVFLLCSKMLRTFLQACDDVPQPSVETWFPPIRGAPLCILLKRLSRSNADKRVPLYSGLLVSIVQASTFFCRAFTRSFLSRPTAKKGNGKAHHVAESAQVPFSGLTHSGELHRADVKRKPVVCHAPLNDAKSRLLQRLGKHWKVQPGSVSFRYSSGIHTLSERSVGQSGGGRQPDIFGMLHEVAKCSSPQKSGALQVKGKKWASLQVEMAVMPSEVVEQLEK